LPFSFFLMEKGREFGRFLVPRWEVNDRKTPEKVLRTLRWLS
jgi:hypothetical protein